jgi:hypothetical protein
MYQLMKMKMEGLKRELAAFRARAGQTTDLAQIRDLLVFEMTRLGYDEVFTDSRGNVYGIMNGYTHGTDVLLSSHIHSTNEFRNQTENSVLFASFLDWKDDVRQHLSHTGRTSIGPNVISQMYAGALLRRCILPMNGDIIVACAVADSDNIYVRSRTVFQCAAHRCCRCQPLRRRQ